MPTHLQSLFQYIVRVPDLALLTVLVQLQVNVIVWSELSSPEQPAQDVTVDPQQQPGCNLFNVEIIPLPLYAQ